MPQEATVLCLVADLLDRSRIAGVARAVGTPVAFVSSPGELAKALSTATKAVFLDLNDPKVKALEGISETVSSREGTLPELIGFISHTDEAGAAAARDAGCDEVLTRAQFFKRLSIVLAEAAEK